MNREQTDVALAGLPVLALTLGALWAVEADLVALPASWFEDRFRLGAGCAALIGAVLLLSIWRIAIFRFGSDVDRPGAGIAPPPSPALRIDLAVLQNTLEQSVIAALAYFAFAASAAPRLLALLPIYAGLFAIGRTAFAMGYKYGAGARSFGFGLTFAPSVTLYVLLGAMLFGGL